MGGVGEGGLGTVVWTWLSHHGQDLSFLHFYWDTVSYILREESQETESDSTTKDQ